MKNGFPVRQMLIAVDVLLAGLIIATAYLAAARFLQDEPAAASPALEADDAEDALLRAPAADRAAYDPIVAANLYGTAGRLTGPPIARTEGGELFSGSEPLSEAELAALRREIDARRQSSRDRPGGISAPVPGEVGAEEAPLADVDAERARRRVVDRRAAERELRSVNTAEVFAEASPQLVQDEAGNVRGITSSNIDKIPMARQLGFQQGDVLRMINGVQIDSEQAAIDAIKRFRESPTHWVTIERQGRVQTLVVQLE